LWLWVFVFVGGFLALFCAGTIVVLAAGGAMFGALGAYEYNAAPLQRLPPFVESHAAVGAALGEPVEVSMVVTRTLEHSHSPDGTERADLMTTVSGSRASGMLSAHAQNVGGQGWAGTWEVRSDVQRVLRNGEYVSDGAGVIASGRFAPDGTPIE
jgi:hypothetical protein